MKGYLTRILVASCLCVFASFWASAQVCQVTAASINGSYGFVATQPGPSASTTSSTGTTGPTGTGTTSGTGTTGTTGSAGSTGSTGTPGTTSTSSYSGTPLGQLLSGISAGTQLTVSGVLAFDGAGNIVASAMPGGSPTQVGNYTVNSDCTITVTLMDAFGTATTPATFQGVVLGRGAELDLLSAPASSTTPPSGAGSSGSGSSSTPVTQTQTAVRLTKVLNRNACSVATLQGAYAFVLSSSGTLSLTSTSTGGGGTGTGASGTGTSGTGTPAATSTPSVTLMGEVTFDGAGNVIAPNISTPPSPVTPFSASSSKTAATTLTSLEYTGTYTVNSDCSGTLTISNSSMAANSGTGTSTGSNGSATDATSSGGGSSTTGQTLTISFVITEPTAAITPGVANVSELLQSPGLALAFSDSNESGWGYATAQ